MTFIHQGKKYKNCFKSCISLSTFLCWSFLLSSTKLFAFILWWKNVYIVFFEKLGTLSLKISLSKTALINCWDIKYARGCFLFLRDCKRNYLPTCNCSLVSQKPLCNLTFSFLSLYNNWRNISKIKAGGYIYTQFKI